MQLQMEHLIEITDETGTFIPAPLITEINVEKSIKNLADFATLKCAIFNYNQHIQYELGKIYQLYKRGQKIKIYLGYDDNLVLEFVGYIKGVKTNNDEMIIECEDELFIFRKSVKNREFTTTTVKEILSYLREQLMPDLKIICDYEMSYEKFTIYNATGSDVLQQLQQDTGADIYFTSKESASIGQTKDFFEPLVNTRLTSELHFRMPFTKRNESKCDYSLQHNVETSNLEFVDHTDKKIHITITGISKSGKNNIVEFGDQGGDNFELKVNRVPSEDMKKRAKMEYDRRKAPGYSGTFTGWLIPYVEPNYSIGIYDDDFPEKDGIYNVDSVTTNFSEKGGVRTITPGIKVG